MKTDTKQKIIDAGARIIHRKGFNHTGIQEVLAAAGVPKGSFYFYFKNKEDFGLQVVDHYSQMFAQMAQPILSDPSRPPLARIERLLDHFIGLFRDLDFTCGCPVGNLAQEMGDLSDAFGKKLDESIEAMADAYERVLAEARGAGAIPDDLDLRETAYFIISGWHGALIRMKIVKSTVPLEIHKRHFLKSLKRSGA
jgi:TetR/AcrR family transcriptional repressor of nem operon